MFIRTKVSDLLGLMKTLRPQDCGKRLMRMGSYSDGGYLIPDDLDGIEYCFSPGVGNNCDFESSLADLGIKSFLADYSINLLPKLRPEFTFDRKFLGIRNNRSAMTLATWKEKYLQNHTPDLLLQMDIEGAEWPVIINTPDDLLDQFRIMVIEFHNLHHLFDLFGYSVMSACFEKILESFYVVHSHPNNCGITYRMSVPCDTIPGETVIEVPTIMEMTFLNRKRGRPGKCSHTFPHPLDRDNDPNRSSVMLPQCWQ